jgi:hypothetical protein
MQLVSNFKAGQMYSISFDFNLQQRGVGIPGRFANYLNTLRASINTLGNSLISQNLTRISTPGSWESYTSTSFIARKDSFHISFIFDYDYQSAGYASPYYTVNPILFIDNIKVNEYFHVIDPSFESYATLFNDDDRGSNIYITSNKNILRSSKCTSFYSYNASN